MPCRHLVSLALATLLLGCADNPGLQPRGPQVFADPLPPLPYPVPLQEPWAFLAGMGLGLALGWLLAWLWRKRRVSKSLQATGQVPEGDLGLLRAIVRLMDQLALGWRRRQKIRPLRRRQPPPRP